VSPPEYPIRRMGIVASKFAVGNRVRIRPDAPTRKEEIEGTIAGAGKMGIVVKPPPLKESDFKHTWVISVELECSEDELELLE